LISFYISARDCCLLFPLSTLFHPSPLHFPLLSLSSSPPSPSFLLFCSLSLILLPIRYSFSFFLLFTLFFLSSYTTCFPFHFPARWFTACFSFFLCYPYDGSDTAPVVSTVQVCRGCLVDPARWTAKQ
jgi:hypothetical protein